MISNDGIDKMRTSENTVSTIKWVNGMTVTKK